MQPQFKAEGLKAPWRAAGVNLCSKDQEFGIWWPQVTTAAKNVPSQEGSSKCASEPPTSSAFSFYPGPPWVGGTTCVQGRSSPLRGLTHMPVISGDSFTDTPRSVLTNFSCLSIQASWQPRLTTIIKGKGEKSCRWPCTFGEVDITNNFTVFLESTDRV